MDMNYFLTAGAHDDHDDSSSSNCCGTARLFIALEWPRSVALCRLTAGSKLNSVRNATESSRHAPPGLSEGPSVFFLNSIRYFIFIF